MLDDKLHSAFEVSVCLVRPIGQDRSVPDWNADGSTLNESTDQTIVKDIVKVMPPTDINAAFGN